MDTPELLNRENLNEVWVDATPDGHYAERLLQAYRQRSLVRYRVEGVPVEREVIYAAMNEHQEARARELDEALAILAAWEKQGSEEEEVCHDPRLKPGGRACSSMEEPFGSR